MKVQERAGGVSSEVFVFISLIREPCWTAHDFLSEKVSKDFTDRSATDGDLMSGCLQARLEGSFILLLTFLLVTNREARGCVPMQGGITPSVTPSVRTTITPVSTTTTLPSTTTSTPFLECATCSPMDIKFEPADPSAGFVNFDPSRGELSFDSSGCVQLLLTCRASPLDNSAYMRLNGNTISMATKTISTTLSCDADGAWKSFTTTMPITYLACGFL